MTLTVQDSREISFRIQDSAIADMRELYMPLRIHDVRDKQQLKAVRDARLTVKQHRVDVEKKRKELKADALEWGRKVDNEAKRITALLAPIEQHLQAEEDKVNEEERRLKREAEEAAKAELERRISELYKFNCVLPVTTIQEMTAEDFDRCLADSKQEFQERQAKQEAEKKERERVAKQQALEAKRLAAEREKLEAEQQRIREEQHQLELAKQKKEEEEKAKQQAIEAAERSRIETEQRLAREAEEKKAAEQRAEEARKRAEQLKPDREKLEAFAETLMEIELPSFKHKDVDEFVCETFDNTITALRKFAKEMK